MYTKCMYIREQFNNFFTLNHKQTMETLSFRTQELIEDRLFPMGESAWDRWAEFCYTALESDKIVPLWAEYSFRWGYQIALNIKDALNDWDGHGEKIIVDKEKAIDKIINLFDDVDCVESCEALIKCIEILLTTTENRTQKFPDDKRRPSGPVDYSS